MSQQVPKRNARKSTFNFIFNLNAFWLQGRGPHGVLRWLPEAFSLECERSQGQFLKFVCNEDKENRKTRSEKRPEKQGARATNDNFFHNKVITDLSAVAGLGETVSINSTPVELNQFAVSRETASADNYWERMALRAPGTYTIKCNWTTMKHSYRLAAVSL